MPDHFEFVPKYPDDILMEVYHQTVKLIASRDTLVGMERGMIRPKNVFYYEEKDCPRRTLSSADYPNLEIVTKSCGPAGGASNAWKRDRVITIGYWSGERIYHGFTSLAEIEMMKIFHNIRPLNWMHPQGQIFDVAMGNINHGRFSHTYQAGTIQGWMFQFDLTYTLELDHRVF